MSTSIAKHRRLPIVARVIALAVACTGLLGCQQGLNKNSRVVEGSYDAEVRYDFSSLTGSIGRNVSVSQPIDRLITDEILSRVDAQAGSMIGSLVRQYYEQTLQQDVFSYLNAEAPAWVLSLPGKLALVEDQMSLFDVQTSLLVAGQEVAPAPQDAATMPGFQTSYETNYEVTEIWNGISVFSDPECKRGGGLNCSLTQLSLQNLLDSEYPIEVISTRMQAIDRGDQLQLEGHEIRFNYGRLGLYLLTNLILPPEPGNDLALRDVVLSAINCRGLAGRLAGKDDILGIEVAGFEVGVSISDLVGSCQSGVFAMVNDVVDQFSIPFQMNVGGSVNIADRNFDGRIDQLTSRELAGDYSLAIGASETQSGPVSGIMTGFRVGDLPEGFETSDGLAGDGSVEEDDGQVLWEADE